MKIYTRKGDTGQTSIRGGEPLSKRDSIFELLGRLDELNCYLGNARSYPELEEAHTERLKMLQGNIFEIGALISMPSSVEPGKGRAGASEHYATLTKSLEDEIDQITQLNEPITSFILPGGTPLSSAIHIARALCRLAELSFWRWLGESVTPVQRAIGVFLNRLSDYLFMLASYYNDRGRNDIKWKSA